MDITPTTTIITNINNTATPTTTIAIAAAATSSKSPEHETETPPRIANTTTPPPTKALSFSNGVLKRHHPSSYHHHHHHPLSANHTTMAVAYKECLKNHAANLGGHALDGCGEFMPAPSATAADPSSLKCAACGCHRNFHRREPEEPPISTAVIEYQPHHRHHPPPPPSFQPSSRSPNSASPPPISSSYYPSAPHMLLALSTGLAAPPENAAGPTSSSRKRFRTKFSQEQKEKMLKFAERVGWKMQKKDEDFVQDFCNEIGIERGVLKVWMHNNKNTFGKRDGSNEINNNNINNNINNAGSAKSFFAKENHDPVITNISSASEINGNGNRNHGAEDPIHHHFQNDGGATVRANGSSSS